MLWTSISICFGAPVLVDLGLNFSVSPYTPRNPVQRGKVCSVLGISYLGRGIEGLRLGKFYFKI